MKLLSLFRNKSVFLILCMLSAFWVFAQDKKLDVDISVNKDTQQWYAQPWVWVVGGAVFILILVALIRGKSKN